MSSDEQSEKECPLCMEQLELDDMQFYPCKCEYQICRFCWHRIRTDENGLCPACRQPYPEDPVNFKPLSNEELQKIKTEKKRKQQQQRMKMSESRKHLASYRVLQKNLVYVVGLSPRVADPDTLKKPEYFGKYGRIHKVVVGTTTGTAQSASCTAYLTYVKADDALRAIQAVNNVQLDGRLVKASLGTTKYCSSFLRNQPCHKQECMYLHDVADMEVSFTKEDMHQGRHADYERRLSEQVLNCVVDKTHHRRSPKPKQRAQEHPADGETAGHRSARNHNAAPRHRNKQTSKSVERSAPKAVQGHHRTCSNHSLSKDTLVEQPSPATSDPQTGASTPAQMSGSVPNEPMIGSSSDASTHLSADSVGQQDWPVSRLLSWTTQQQTAATDSLSTGDAFAAAAAAARPASSLSPSSASNSAHLLRGGTCDSVEKAQFMCNGLDRQDFGQTTSDAEPSSLNTAPTDWQAAFGLKPLLANTSRHRIPSMHSDDDLGFDPFSESSKGLADLLEQEKVEQRERQQLRSNRERHTSFGSAMPSSAIGQSGSYSGWNMNGRQPSPFVPGAPWEKPSSFPSSGMVRPHGSPVLQQFTTPPPTLPSPLTNGQFDSNKSYNNGAFGGGELPNGVRGFGGSGHAVHHHQQGQSLGFPPGLTLPSTAQPPPLHQRPLSPHDQTMYSSMTEWQEGLKALLPNVNVHFAPELHSPSGPPKQSPSNGPIKPPNRNWMHHPPPLPPFTQPPPPLSVSTSFGCPSPMRPSPTGASDPFGHHGLNGPTSRPPPGYPTGAVPWQTVTTPPPPGFSPGAGKR